MPPRPSDGLHLFSAWNSCARDANGSYLRTELRVLLDESGVEEPGEREAWFRMVDVVDAEARAVKMERWEQEMRQLGQQK